MPHPDERRTADGTAMSMVESGKLAGEQLRARIAWYYFVAGLTQQEISDRLGVSRARVNKIAGQLRADGSVIIDVRLPLASCVELEEKLKQTFGLKSAAVVPALDDDELQRRMLGEAAAAILEEMFEDGQNISVGWGRTLSLTIKQLRSRQLYGASVVSLMGGLTRGSETNTFGVSTELARTLGADCYYITAPVYCPCVESREFLLQHSGVNEVMERARRSNLSIVSCGDLTPRTPLTTINSVRERLPQIKECGAIGEILGTFLDARGVPVKHELNDTVIAMSPADLKNVPDRLLISGGLYKARIIRAILVAGYVNHLVVDEAVARKLLQRT
jgi:DNA-binding transcriptional regulator LsrR (DeoR family)